MPSKSILIIDDDANVRDVVGQFFRNLGYTMFFAVDGYDGPQQARTCKPDLIVLDFQMPAADGAGVYEKLQTSSDTAHIPVIFISGRDFSEIHNGIPISPGVRFLSKPLDFKKLFDLAGELLAEFSAK